MKASEITALIVAQIGLPVHLRCPINIMGPPRIGKSGSVKSAVKQTGAAMFDVRLSTIQDVDISGMPSIVTDASGRAFSRFAWPAVFPLPDCGPTVLFFDELDKGLPSTLNAALGVIYDRQIHGHRLSDNVTLVAGSNRTQDRAHSQRLGTAMSPRWINVDFDFDMRDFLTFAIGAEFAPLVVAFLKWRDKFGYAFDPASDESSFPAPATWEYVSNLLQSNLPRNIFEKCVLAAVGKEASTEFLGFMRTADDLPSIEEIRVNPTGARLPEEVSARYAAAAMLGRRMTGTTAKAFILYLDRLGKAFSAFGVSAAIKRDPSICGAAAFQDWSQRNDKVLFA